MTASLETLVEPLVDQRLRVAPRLNLVVSAPSLAVSRIFRCFSRLAESAASRSRGVRDSLTFTVLVVSAGMENRAAPSFVCLVLAALALWALGNPVVARLRLPVQVPTWVH